MRVPVVLAILTATVVLTRPVAAEDFSGFYAGMNAGYAFGTGERDGSTPGPVTGAPASASDTGLPPSAREAARTLREAAPRAVRPGQAR